jgi:hypothetical protein
MRISTLLLFLSGLFIVAPARSQAEDESGQSIPSLKFNLANADGVAIDQYQLPELWNRRLGRLAMDNVGTEQDQVCYTMRSYRVERTERVDESTQPLKYSRCQSSSEFDLKNADERVVEPEVPQP